MTTVDAADPPAKEPLPPLPVEPGPQGLVVTTVMGMPLGRYFVFVGSLMLASLFLADRYMPKLAATPDRADVDRTVIRLHSAHQWPERIVIDTSLPTLVPPAATIAAEAQLPPKTRPPNEAFALASPQMPSTHAAPSTSKPVQKRRTRTTRIPAERIASYDMTGHRTAFPAGW